MRRMVLPVALIMLALSAAGAFAAEHESQLNAEYWWDQFVKFFNLALVVGLLIFLLRKPVKNFFSERARQIDESLDSAKQARDEAQQRLAEVEERIAGLEQRMAEILDKARKEGEVEKTRIIAAAEREAERILELAKHEIENRSKATRKELKTFTVDEAIEHARKLLHERLGPEKDEHLIDLFLDDLGGRGPQ
jgi:F-type H+-transporting ATPase subunit b